MRLSPFIVAAVASLAPVLAQDQIVFDAEHNASSIIGTWSSGSRSVRTGADFVNPANMSFKYPKNTGVSFSFSASGFFEVARYRFNSNGTQPNCIVGVVMWNHGTYDLLNNGSILLHPFGDGFQQIQDPCAAVSNFLENYNITEYFRAWRIFRDPTDGFKLHLFGHDGAPVAPLFQVSEAPIMLPTRMLRNVSTGTEEEQQLQRRSNAAPSMVQQTSQVVATFAGAVLLGSIALML